MARGTTLSTLVTMLKGEVGDSLSVGTQADALYKQLLANKQKWLVGELSFPFLQRRWDVTVAAASRFVAFPTTTLEGESTTGIDFERPFKLEVKYNDIWREVQYGITNEEYNVFDSDANPVELYDPIHRYAYADNARFEVWPRPASAQTVRFTGQRVLPALTGDSDTAVVDDLLLVLAVAVDLLSKKKDPSAQMRFASAQRRLQTLRAAYPSYDKPIIFGRRDEEYKCRRVVVGGVRGVATTIYGTHDIANGVSEGEVVFSAPLPRDPVAVLSVTVVKPSGGFELAASVVAGTLDREGFQYTLTGVTDSANYDLVYFITYNNPDV